MITENLDRLIDVLRARLELLTEECLRFGNQQPSMPIHVLEQILAKDLDDFNLVLQRLNQLKAQRLQIRAYKAE